MLNSIGSNDNIKENISNQILESETINSKFATNPIKNDYSKFFVDESNISNEALKKLDLEKLINRFSKLALSEPINGEEDKLVANMFLNSQIDVNDDDLSDFLINSKKFMNDLNG